MFRRKNWPRAIVLLLSMTSAVVLLLKPSSVLLPTESVESVENREADKEAFGNNYDNNAPSASPGVAEAPADSASIAPNKYNEDPRPPSEISMPPVPKRDPETPEENRTMEQLLGELNRDRTYSSTRGVTLREKNATNEGFASSLYGLGNDELIKLFDKHESKYCMKQQCFEETAKTLARAFPDQTNTDKWCFSKDTQNQNSTANTTNPKHRGLILVKVPKAASSTMAGIVLRLGYLHNCNMDYIHWAHRQTWKEYAGRDSTKSVMLLSVRDPSRQLVSNLFWSQVSLREKERDKISDGWLLTHIIGFSSTQGDVRKGQGGYTTQYASMENIPHYSAWSQETRDVVAKDRIVDGIQTIMEQYDFIAVVERMDESLVALALLLGVNVGDVLVTSSKVSAVDDNSNQTDKVAYVYSDKRKRCLPMVPSFVPPLVQHYLKSDMFRSQMYGDYLLYAAANQSLDLTIQRLGVERFQVAIKEYRYWKEKERTECASRVEFPCSSSGNVQQEVAAKNCYKRDLGCGHQCLDEMLAQGMNQN